MATCPMVHGAPGPRGDAGGPRWSVTSSQHLPTLFSLHLSALFGKSPLGNSCNAKRRVVPDQALIEFGWRSGTLCLLPDFPF